MIPSLFPLFDITTRNLNDGAVIAASSFCRKAISAKPECRRHYDSLKAKPEGYHQCPFGMTSRNFYFDGALKVITGVIAFPRFDSQAEQNMAKKFPEIKVSRDTIEKSIRFLRETEKLKAAAVQEATQVLPQAFHELRKLNGAINEAPRSKLRGITELKHSELPEIFARLSLPLYVPLNRLPVRSLSYRRHIVPVGPKFSAPQYSFDGRFPSKDFPSCDALEHLHNPPRSHFRVGTAEQMNMILIRSNRFHCDRKPSRNLCRRFLNNRRHLLI